MPNASRSSTARRFHSEAQSSFKRSRERLLAHDVRLGVVEPGTVEARQILAVRRAAHEHAPAAELEPDPLVDHVERGLVDRRVLDRLAQALERLLAPRGVGLEPLVGEDRVELHVEVVLLHVLDVVVERHAEPGRHAHAVEVRGHDLAEVRGLGPVGHDVLRAHPGQHREPRDSSRSAGGRSTWWAAARSGPAAP